MLVIYAMNKKQDTHKGKGNFSRARERQKMLPSVKKLPDKIRCLTPLDFLSMDEYPSEHDLVALERKQQLSQAADNNKKD